jgi:hypothetical protein
LIKVSLKNFEHIEPVSKKNFLNCVREAAAYNDIHGNDEKKRNKKKKKTGAAASTDAEAETDSANQGQSFLDKGIEMFGAFLYPGQKALSGEDTLPSVPIKSEVAINNTENDEAIARAEQELVYSQETTDSGISSNAAEGDWDSQKKKKKNGKEEKKEADGDGLKEIDEAVPDRGQGGDEIDGETGPPNHGVLPEVKVEIEIEEMHVRSKEDEVCFLYVFGYIYVYIYGIFM